MATVLQIIFVLVLILLIIFFVYQPRRSNHTLLPENFRDVLHDYVAFYNRLGEAGKKQFDEKLRKFLSAVRITGANAQAEDLDIVLIAAAAVIPTYHIPDWEYINLREVLLYPGNFNLDYEQQGRNRMFSGMVGTGGLENVMILSKWELRQGFINGNSNRNTAIHEFVHLIDKMDGTLDGVPELLLPRQFVPRWQQLLAKEMEQIRNGASDVDAYGATCPVECFAVLSEYFFEQPENFRMQHPEWAELMERVFVRR